MVYGVSMARSRKNCPVCQQWCVVHLAKNIFISHIFCCEDEFFLILYKELYFRHIYAHHQVRRYKMVTMYKLSLPIIAHY